MKAEHICYYWLLYHTQSGCFVEFEYRCAQSSDRTEIVLTIELLNDLEIALECRESQLGKYYYADISFRTPNGWLTLYSYEEAVFDAIMTLVEAIMKECVLIKEIEREEKEEEVSKSG